MDVTHYDLELTYKVSANRLTGHAAISAVAHTTLPRFTLDLASTLTVAKVAVDGARPAKYAHRHGVLHIAPRRPIPAGTRFTVTVGYGGGPVPVRGPWGDVGWEELTDGVLVASQPNGAPSWFPCVNDPTSKASYRFTITAESPYHVLANGTLVSTRTKASRTTWVYDQPEPMAAYLATVSIGQYEKWVLPSDGPVPLYVVAPPALRSAAAHDFARQSHMMAVFSNLFGPYPFAAYTVVVTADDLEIPIEAHGISTFGANHCDGFRGSERLIAHELAHQWFGNSLTLRQWSDIWLHEGFACYAEWLWSEASGGPSADSLARAAHITVSRLPQDLVLADPGERLMFDDRVYKRGALTLHALRTELGDAEFFRLLREWTAAHRHSWVTTADFLARTPSRLAGFWKSWLWDRKLPKDL